MQLKTATLSLLTILLLLSLALNSYLFQQHVVPLQPDLIIVQMCINDLKTIPHQEFALDELHLNEAGYAYLNEELVQFLHAQELIP